MGTRAEPDGVAVVIPADLPPGKIRTGDTPCWEAALAKHHKALVSAGVTTWAEEGRKLVPSRPRKTKATTSR